MLKPPSYLGVISNEPPVVIVQDTLNLIVTQGLGAEDAGFLGGEGDGGQGEGPALPFLSRAEKPTPRGTHGLLGFPRLLLRWGATSTPLALNRHVPVLRPLHPLKDGPDDTAGHGRRAEEPLALAEHDEVLAGMAGQSERLSPPSS